jgi:hypothetical protein
MGQEYIFTRSLILHVYGANVYIPNYQALVF